MKVSISLAEEDLAVLDAYRQTSGLPSRSAVVQHALRMLQRSDLQQDYAEAWDEWRATGDQDLWDSTAADGLVDAPR